MAATESGGCDFESGAPIVRLVRNASTYSVTMYITTSAFGPAYPLGLFLMAMMYGLLYLARVEIEGGGEQIRGNLKRSEEEEGRP